MNFFLLGYMGSGKSYIGKELAKVSKHQFLDLDREIEEREGLSISEIFDKNGEIYFRKAERKLLEEVLNSGDSRVISLGGGTPCYGDNLEIIKKNENSTTIYLKLKVENLTERLFKEKDHRPLISHLKDKEKLEEFIRKHLFERGFYYNQSEHIINCDNKSKEDLVTEIIDKLG
ncbi:shikimate kinase [Christiangramia salexigens]|uniref:Shikimate kinase n=1 Tax=Christiangramia salexigens TaxID=1913577 RepID=A0A1L3J1E8_9FLAO|nr:shikimate kinase [Christiangramia salexigens]APG58937.1 shikimate kinase [Christiangramia salexigens]